jgi:peroxiredoxin
MKAAIFYLIALCLVLSCAISSAQVQDTVKKFPKVLFYSIEGKLVPNDKINDVLKTMGSIVSIAEKRYGNDSIVYRLVKVREEELKKHRDAEAQRIVKTRAMIGKPIKDFSVIDIKGRKHQLSKYRGKVVVLNFWFTACTPCIDEIPEINRLADKYKKADVKFLAITYESLGKVNAFLKDHSFEIPIATDARNIVDEFYINLFPTTLIIGKKGILNAHLNDEKQLDVLISKEIAR